MKKLRWIPWAIAVLVLGGAAVMYFVGWDYASNYFSSSQVEGKSASQWITALNDPDKDVRVKAIQSLARVAPEATEAVPTLTKILTEAEFSPERVEAAITLAKMIPASYSAVPALAKALDDKEPWVRLNSARCLEEMGRYARKNNQAPPTKAAIPALTKALKDKDNQQTMNIAMTIFDRCFMALCWATVDSDEAIPTLVETMERYREEHKNVVIRTDQQGKSQKENTKLDNAATDATKVIRTKVFFAMGMGELGPRAKPAVPVLKQMLKEDQISDYKPAAEEALPKIEVK